MSAGLPELTTKNAGLPSHLPKVGARPAQILVAQEIIGLDFPADYARYLSLANGWKDRCVQTDLFGTDDFLKSAACSGDGEARNHTLQCRVTDIGSQFGMDKDTTSEIECLARRWPGPGRSFSMGGFMENRLLAYLSAPDLGLLAPHLKQVPLLHGAVLHEPERPLEWVYFPMSGAVSLLVVMKAGEAVEIASVGRQGAIGLSTHSGPWRARTRAIVQVAGIAKAVPAPVLGAMIAQREDMRDLMIRYQETLWAQSQRMAACNALHSVEERLARWLLQMSDRIESAEIPITQDTLAHLLGVRRTTVTLIAHNLQMKGVIRYRRGHVAIVSPRQLHALTCECYDACNQGDELVRKTDPVLKASHSLDAGVASSLSVS